MDTYNNEKILLSGRPSAMGYVMQITLGATCVVLDLKYHAFFHSYLAMLGLVFVAAAYYNIMSWKYLVTDRRIMVEQGIFSRVAGELDINDVRAINVSQTLTERMMGIGNIEFTSAAGTVNEVKMVSVNKPRQVKDMIYRCKSTSGASHD